MATSGSKDFSVTRSDLIAAALRKAGAYDSGETVQPEDEADAAFALNVLLKEWSARGIDIFVRSEFVLFQQARTLSAGSFVETPQTTYTLGPPQTGPEAAASSEQNWYIAALTSDLNAGTLTADVAAGATQATANLESTATADDHYVIQLDDGSWHITNLTNIVTYTIKHIMPGPASAGNTVFAFTQTIPKPYEIIYAMRRNNDGNDVPVGLIGEVEYQRLNRKEQQGATTQVWYKPGLTDGELFAWPVGINDGGYSRLIMQATFYPDDMDTVSNEPEFPIEWANAIIFNLAHDIAPEYGLSRTERVDLYTIGQGKLTEQLDANQENANVVITLDQRASGG